MHPRQHFGLAGLVFAVVLVCWMAFALPRPIPTDTLPGQLENAELAAAMANGTVAVDLYGESLCPDTQHIVLDVLKPMFESGLAKLMNLRYVALGNVHGSLEAGISCQHGAVECLHNRYINCAQRAAPDQDAWFPYVVCLAHNMRSMAKERDACADGAGLRAAELQACAEGDVGAELERAAFKETAALRPKHTFVPWTLVNGIAVGADFEILDRFVCVAADPRARPATCYEVPRKLQTMRG